MDEAIGYPAAFIAGLFSFISPCVLPLIPGYITFITGSSVDDLLSGAGNRMRMLGVALTSLCFVAGFTTIFLLMGAGAGLLGQTAMRSFPLFSKIGAVVIIIFGLHLTGLLKIKFLYYEKRLDVRTKPIGLVGAYLVGLAFGFGWSPCIGPQLAAILLLASTSGKAMTGMALLLVYSLGLAIPFLLTGLFLERALTLFKAIRKWFRAIELTAGIFLILLGVLILTGLYQRLIVYLTVPGIM